METEAQRIARQWGVLYLPSGEKNNDVISAIQQALDISQHPQVGFTREQVVKGMNEVYKWMDENDSTDERKVLGDVIEDYLNSLHPAPNNNFKGFAEFLWQFLLQCDISDVTSYDIQVNKAIESYVHPAPVETDWTVKQEKDIVQASKEFALSNDINWNTEIELMIVNAIREVQSNPVEPKDEYKQPIIAMTPKGLVDTNGKPCTCPRCMGGIDYYPKDEVEPKDDVDVEKDPTLGLGYSNEQREKM